jgi:hypothetical protein
LSLPFTPTVGNLVSVKGERPGPPYVVTSVDPSNGEIWLAKGLVISGPWRADQLKLETTS